MLVFCLYLQTWWLIYKKTGNDGAVYSADGCVTGWKMGCRPLCRAIDYNLLDQVSGKTRSHAVCALFYEMFKERKMFRQATSVLIRLTGEVGSSECLKGKTGSITKTRPGLGLEKWTFPRTDCALFLAVYPSIRPQVCVSSRSGRPSIQ